MRVGNPLSFMPLPVILFAIIWPTTTACSEDGHENPWDTSTEEGVCESIGDYDIGRKNVWIETEEQLERLHASGCTTVDGELRIYFIPGVTDLRRLENIEQVNWGIEIAYTEDLKSLEGMQNLAEYPWLSLHYNSELTDTGALQAPESAREVEGFELSISSNESLHVLRGLEGMQTPEFITIDDNPTLAGIPALDDAYTGDLDTLFARIRIERNPNLPQCRVDEILNRLPEDQYISVTGNNDSSALCDGG